MDKQIEFLVKLRDTSQMIANAAKEDLETFTPPGAKENKQLAAVQEITFSTLRFEPQQPAKKLQEFLVILGEVNRQLKEELEKAKRQGSFK